MSYHSDTTTALRDSRINVCDLYLFQGRPGATVMAMTVNPDAGISAPDTFHEEGLCAFRFALDRSAKAELAFKVRFGAVEHGDGDEHRHVQQFEVRRATGPAALHGAHGEQIISGCTGEVTMSGHGVAAYAGLGPDLFAGDAATPGVFRNALFMDNKFDPGAFLNRKNFFANRNITAIVLELPTEMVGHGLVHAWATASLYGHAPEMQVSRWGLPLITDVSMPDSDMKEQFNRSTPADDQTPFIAEVAMVAERLTTLAGSTTDLGDGVERSELSVPGAPSTASSHDKAAGSRIGRSLTDAGGELL
jgi:hypothetical protein